MKVRNKDIYLKWKGINSEDGYSFDIFKFSEKWAELMEVEIEKGKSLDEISKETAKIAGVNELTKTMFEASLNILYRCWIYGYELESWIKKNRIDGLEDII